MKILAVCGFVLGSTMVLKMTLSKVAQEMGLDADIQNTDIETAKATKADVYFTSAELAEDLKNSTSNPVIPIKKYMDKTEVRNALQKYLDSKKA